MEHARGHRLSGMRRQRRGFTASVMPMWGQAASGVSRLWDQRGTAGGAVSPVAAGRLDAELGYGLATLRGRGLLTPYARVALSEGAGQAWHLRTRLALRQSLNLSLEARRRTSWPGWPISGDKGQVNRVSGGLFGLRQHLMREGSTARSTCFRPCLSGLGGRRRLVAAARDGRCAARTYWKWTTRWSRLRGRVLIQGWVGFVLGLWQQRFARRQGLRFAAGCQERRCGTECPSYREHQTALAPVNKEGETHAIPCIGCGQHVGSKSGLDRLSTRAELACRPCPARRSTVQAA